MERLRDKEATVRSQAAVALSKLAFTEDSSELDEDETHDFSHGMVKAYFTQAHNPFDKMDVAL